MLTDWLLALLWMASGSYWLAAAAGNRRAERVEPRPSRLVHLLLVAAAFLLLFVEPRHNSPLAIRILPAGSAAYVSGLSLAVTGLGLATRARLRVRR